MSVRTRALVVCVLVSGCQSVASFAPRVLPLDQGPLYSSPEKVADACALTLSEAHRVRAEILEAAPGRGPTEAPERTLLRFNALLGSLENAAGVMTLFANVHPEAAIRGASEGCEQSLQKLSSALSLDPALYQRLRSVTELELVGEAKRFRAKLLEKMTLAGVDRSPEVRTRLQALEASMLSAGQAFQRNIRDDVRAIEVEPSELLGLPDDFLASHPVNAAGKIVLDTSYPDFFPVQTYAVRPAVRTALMQAFSSRGYPANGIVLKELLELRHEYARLLGHRSWAELRAKDKMLDSAAKVRAFTEDVAVLARPRMQRDLDEVLAEKLKTEPDALRVERWDRLYYVKEVQKRKHDFDPALARVYFGYDAVLEGVFAVFSELFELDFVPIVRPAWHASVKSFELRLRGAPVGRFFLDMHPRDGKYGHAAMFPITTGLREGALGEAALVCNFPDPNKGPALMEHAQVVTLFHEFGHLLHHLLARNSSFVNQSGISTEWDFVEAPSQLFEEWAFDAEVLRRFAKDPNTGAPMPEALIGRMRSARDFGLGLQVMRQTFYQALSLEFHDRPPESFEFDALSVELEERYAPHAPMPGTHDYASFGHLDEYSSLYYTYQWSLALAKDLFTRFLKEGLVHPPVARSYRDAVLRPGGMKPASRLVADFLGREASLDAYRAWLAGSEPEALSEP